MVAKLVSSVTRTVETKKLKMTSNEDLLMFLKSMEEKRAKDREDDKKEWRETRERERREDKEEMLKVIDTCIVEKISGVVGPLEDKTDSVVKAQGQLQDQVDKLAKELNSLKDKESSNEQAYTGIIQQGVRQVQLHQAARVAPVIGGGQGDELEQVVSEARRTVGLHRIDRKT